MLPEASLAVSHTICFAAPRESVQVSQSGVWYDVAWWFRGRVHGGEGGLDVLSGPCLGELIHHLLDGISVMTYLRFPRICEDEVVNVWNHYGDPTTRHLSHKYKP